MARGRGRAFRRHVPRVPVWRAAAWRHGGRGRPHRDAAVRHDQPARNLAVSDEPAGRRPADGSTFGGRAQAIARAAHPAQSADRTKPTEARIRGRGSRRGECMSSYSEDLQSAALAYHRLPRPGKLEIQAIKPLANQRDLALAYSPGVAAACMAIASRSGGSRLPDHPRQSGRRGLERHRGARPRQYRSAGVEAGDGRQGGPVQEIRRHRRVRHRDRRRHRRARGRDRGGAGADLRRHQSRGHQGAGVLRDRGAAQGAHEDPGIPRRPARHRDHRRRRDHQCAAAERQETRGRQDRRLRRRRRGDRLPQSAGLDGRAAQEHLGLRHRRRGARRPQHADGPLEVGLCAEDREAQAGGSDRRRRYFPRPVGAQRADAGHGQGDGGQAAGDGAGQSRRRRSCRTRPARRAPTR